MLLRRYTSLLLRKILSSPAARNLTFAIPPIPPPHPRTQLLSLSLSFPRCPNFQAERANKGGEERRKLKKRKREAKVRLPARVRHKTTLRPLQGLTGTNRFILLITRIRLNGVYLFCYPHAPQGLFFLQRAVTLYAVCSERHFAVRPLPSLPPSCPTDV